MLQIIKWEAFSIFDDWRTKKLGQQLMIVLIID